MRPACLLLTLAILRSPAWGKYLYADQDVVKEYTGPASAGNFTLSTNNRVVEFYSPYCVRTRFLSELLLHRSSR
jgi:hypothetical protein